MRRPLLWIALTATAVVGALTGVSAIAYAAGAPVSPTVTAPDAGLTVAPDHRPTGAAAVVEEPDGVAVVHAAHPIAGGATPTPSASPSAPGSAASTGAGDDLETGSHGTAGSSDGAGGSSGSGQGDDSSTADVAGSDSSESSTSAGDDAGDQSQHGKIGRNASPSAPGRGQTSR
ncbi:hypothetical protein [Mesorhizobium japonicum]|uniref:hypothetical protein n=1 Tax=Mesorhizobium japonicum TaxID=2066070 RepID=UPI003B59D689